MTATAEEGLETEEATTINLIKTFLPLFQAPFLVSVLQRAAGKIPQVGVGLVSPGKEKKKESRLCIGMEIAARVVLLLITVYLCRIRLRTILRDQKRCQTGCRWQFSFFTLYAFL